MNSEPLPLPIEASSESCNEAKSTEQSSHGAKEHCCSSNSSAEVKLDSLPNVTPTEPTENATAANESVPPDDAALIDALRTVIDPELMINIVDLGLVYSINQTDRKVLVEMTLTSPACPAGPQIVSQAKMSIEKLEGVETAEIKLTMSPPWTPDRMTDDARDQLGIF